MSPHQPLTIKPLLSGRSPRLLADSRYCHLTRYLPVNIYRWFRKDSILLKWDTRCLQADKRKKLLEGVSQRILRRNIFPAFLSNLKMSSCVCPEQGSGHLQTQEIPSYCISGGRCRRMWVSVGSVHLSVSCFLKLLATLWKRGIRELYDGERFLEIMFLKY